MLLYFRIYLQGYIETLFFIRFSCIELFYLLNVKLPCILIYSYLLLLYKLSYLFTNLITYSLTSLCIYSFLTPSFTYSLFKFKNSQSIVYFFIYIFIYILIFKYLFIYLLINLCIHLDALIKTLVFIYLRLYLLINLLTYI